MPTHVVVDDDLIEEVRRLGGHKTKKAAATAALEEYIKYRKQLKILEMEGTVDYDPEYREKVARWRES